MRRPSAPRPASFGRPLLACIVLLAFVVPGVGAAQPVSQGEQYQTPAAMKPLPKVGAGTQAKVFNLQVEAAGSKAACAVPTLARCKDVNYLVTACGQAHQTTCRDLMRPEYEAYFATLGQSNRKMFPYGSLAQLTDLKTGKFHGTLPTNPTTVRSKSFWDQIRVVAAPTGVDPKTYVAHPSWEANGATVKSCEEYTYEKYYDWQRFQDGVTLCKGNYNCVLDVAYVPGAAPGIASRPLKRKDQVALPAQIGTTIHAPKNAFFTTGQYITTPPTGLGSDGKPRQFEGYMLFSELKTMFPASAADLDQLKTALDDGVVYYGSTGTPGANKTFGSVWGFHSSLRAATSTVTENEFEEFERRRTELEGWMAAILPLPGLNSAGGGSIFEGLQTKEWVNPLSEVEQGYSYDPWERNTMWQDEAVRTNARLQRFQPAALLNHAQLLAPSGAAARLPAGQMPGMSVRSGSAATGSLQAKPKARPAMSSTEVFMAPQVVCQEPTMMDPASWQSLGMAGPQAVARQNQENLNTFAKCKILNLTLREWWRRKANVAKGCTANGSCGCLDLGSAACDWSPKMFYDAYAKQMPTGYLGTVNGVPGTLATMEYLRDNDYDNCKRWTYDGFPTKPADIASGDALEEYLRAKREAIEKVLKKIPQKRDGRNQVRQGVLGQDFSDSALEGDTDSWSAGYNMAAGWELKAAEFSPPTGAGRKTCQLQGSANASFAVKITTPVDGALGDIASTWNHAVDADVWVRANDNKDQKVRYESHLLIGDQELFTTEPTGGYPKYEQFTPYKPNDPRTHESFNLNTTFEKPIFSGVKKTKKLTITVWAGPIPLTGSVWAELHYGANAIAKGEMPSGCVPGMTRFEARAGFEPYFALDGALSLGVGVGGIVSAGVRGYLNLIQAKLPVEARTWLKDDKINFAVDASLDLSTLSGRLALYVEFLMYDEEWELFRWRGLHTNVPLLTAVNEKFDFGALAAISP